MKVDVQGVGLVEFPDDATQDEIAKTVNREFVQKPALKAGLEAGVKLPGQVSHILDLGAVAGDFGRRESAKARLAQEMEQARTQTVGSELQSKFFGGAEKAVGALSQMNPLNVLKRTLELPTQIEQAAGLLPPNAPSPTAPLISQETARKAIDFLDPHSYDEPGSAREGVKQFLAETASGLTSPDQAAAIVAGVKEPELVGRLFQVGAAAQAPEALQSLTDAIQTGDREMIGKSAAALAASTAIPVAIEKGLTRAKAKTGIKPTEEPPPEPTPEVKPVAEPPPTPPKGEPEPQVAPSFSSIEREDGGVLVSAKNPKEEIGWAIVKNLGDGVFELNEIMVKQAYRKQGVATSLYQQAADEVSRQGGKLYTSTELTDEGKALVDSLSKKGMAGNLERVKGGYRTQILAKTPSTVEAGRAPSTAPVKGTAEVGVQAPTEPAKVEGSVTTPVTQVGETAQSSSGLQTQIIDHWRSKVEPVLHDFFKALNTFGVERLERNNIKPAGMSASEWLEKVSQQQPVWGKGGRKTGLTGIQMLSQKNLWPTEGPEGEALRKSMLSAVKALKNAPGRNSRWILNQELSETQRTGTPPQQPVGMGAAVQSEFDQPNSYVSNMFAAIDRDRVEMGKAPMEAGKKRTWDEDNQRALAKMNRDPQWIPSLIDEVLKKPRPLLSWENAGLVWQRAAWKAEANNALQRIARAFDDGREADLAEAKLTAARFEDNIDQLDRAVGKGGTGSEAGRTLQAQKMGAGDDFSLVEMRLQRRAAKGGQKLTPQEEVDIQKQFADYQKTITDLQRHVAERDQKLAEAASQRAFLEAKQPKASDYVIGVAEKWVKQLDAKADAARVRIRERLSRMSAGVDPTLLLDLAEVGASHIGHVGLDFVKWSAKMIEDFGEKVKPFLQEAFAASQKRIDSLAAPEAVKTAIKRTKDTAQDIAQKVKEKAKAGDLSEIAYHVQKLSRMIVQEGVENRDELIDRVHTILKSVLPDITRRQTMDAISGYGQFKKLRKDQVSIELRDLKGQMQQVAKLEDMAAKKAPLKTGIERRAVSDEERRLIKLVNESKYNGGYEITDPETQLRSALQTWKANARNRMVDLERKISEGDYSRPQRHELRLDQEALSMQAKLERIKKKWNEGLRNLERSQRSKWQKGLDAFVKWERAFKLSSPVVFGKLTAAAMTRAVTTGTEEAVGGVLSKVPGISRVAEQAPREGGLNVRAMAAGITDAILKGGKDAWETARKGATDIDFVYGGKLVDKDWANIFGQLHGALKAPVKRGEFRLSLEKRIDHAIRNGVDATDPFVQTRLATEALNDAYRSIFMQHGFTGDMFNQLVTQMERSKKYPVSGELSARIARFFFPVVRVPLNIVSETATGVHGLATASARTMTHVINGTLSDLDPAIADSIMRQFKKGSIGLGLIAIGYMSPQFAGGYDWREKRKPGAVKAGGFQIGGVNIPRWMTHAPWFELMQIGATIRHVKEQHAGGQEKGIGEGAWAASFGLLEETPFVGQMLRAANASMSTNQRNAFLGELAKSTLVPQAIIKAAEVTDPTTGKRVPKTIAEHVKMGIPGLRESVPAKRVE